MLRILHPKLHRSLPELDVLGSDRAWEAVRWALRSRATGRLRSRVSRLVVALAASLLALLAGLVWLVVWVAREHSWQWDEGGWEAWVVFLDWFDPVNRHWWHVLATMAPVLLVFCVAWRLMNRSAVRRVLKRRGMCDWCGYGIGGLPVADGKVKCPECSRGSAVCAAMGEPVEGMFVPAAGLVRAPFWTWRRVKLVAACVAVIGAVWGGVAGVRGFVRHRQVTADAALARADLVMLKEYRELLQQPVPPAGTPNAIELLETIAKEVRDMDAAVRRDKGLGMEASFDAPLLIKGEHTDTPENERDRVFTAAVFDAWLAAGGRARLAELAGPLDYTLLPIVDDAGVVTDFNMIGLTRTRQAMKLCRVVAWRAWESDDQAAWSEGAKAHVACGRAAEQSMTMIGRLVAAAIEKSLLTDIRARVFDLRARPVGDAGVGRWLDAFDGAVVELARTSTTLDRSLEGERLFIRHELAKQFVDVAGIKDGSVEEKLKEGNFLTGRQEGRLGRYAENRDEMKRQFDRMVAEAKLRPVDRTLYKDDFPTGLVMVDMFKPSADSFLLSNDQVVQLRIAVATMIALERVRLKEGSYPESLAGVRLNPVVGTPRDVCGKGEGLLTYRRVAGTAESGGRPGYVLYSVGVDGEDNGGAVTVNLADAFSRSQGKQKDAVYSDPAAK